MISHIRNQGNRYILPLPKRLEGTGGGGGGGGLLTPCFRANSAGETRFRTPELGEACPRPKYGPQNMQPGDHLVHCLTEHGMATCACESLHSIRSFGIPTSNTPNPKPSTLKWHSRPRVGRINPRSARGRNTSKPQRSEPPNLPGVLGPHGLGFRVYIGFRVPGHTSRGPVALCRGRIKGSKLGWKYHNLGYKFRNCSKNKGALTCTAVPAERPIPST